MPESEAKAVAHLQVRILAGQLPMKGGVMEDMLAQIDNWFRYHAPKGDQQERYERIRASAKDFAKVIAECTPPSADQTAALRKLRECVMTANAAIACNESLLV